MMTELEDVGPTEARSILKSREAVVSQVFSGGLTAILGTGAFLGGIYELFGAASFPIALTSVFVASAGLLHLSKAIRHFRRFGSKNAVAGLLGTGALGATVIFWGVSAIFELVGFGRTPSFFRDLAPFLILGSASVVTFAVLKALVARVSEKDTTQADEDVLLSG
jgi:hypothetical protein